MIFCLELITQIKALKIVEEKRRKVPIKRFIDSVTVPLKLNCLEGFLIFTPYVTKIEYTGASL